MEIKDKSTRLWSCFFRWDMPQVRAFHLTWFAFFLCFFAWYGIAPLMETVKKDLLLNEHQMGWIVIASVSMTIVARLIAGWLCDRFGPRLTYTGLLIFGSLPVIGIAFANSYETFLISRLLIGIIGASFVVTQYHTSLMFAPNVVGTANATTAGWGNLGSGVSQVAMPVLLGLFVGALGFRESLGWRAAMFVAGLVCIGMGVVYYFFTQDTPEGNFADLRRQGKLAANEKSKSAFWGVCRDGRVWALFLIYGACFGVELTMNNILARYFFNKFELTLLGAGMAAAAFGMMNLFARTLGGMMGDKFGKWWGLRGRTSWLFLALFCEGIALMVFSQIVLLWLAIPSLVVFAMCVQMANGATFSVVPFINRKGLGSVAGIVGAGGNAGAVAAGFLFKGVAPTEWGTPMLVLGTIVLATSFTVFAVRFSPACEADAKKELRKAAREQEQLAVELEPALTA